MKKLIFIFIMLIILSASSCKKDLEDIKLNDVYFELDKSYHEDLLEEACLKSMGFEPYDYEAYNNQDFNLVFDMELSSDTTIKYIMVNGSKLTNYEYKNNKYYISFNTKENYSFLTYHIEYIRYEKKEGYDDFNINKKFTINILDDNRKNDANISNINTDYTSINFDLRVNDRYRKPNYENIYFYQDYKTFDVKNIRSDAINCNFEALRPNYNYDYIVISNYDLGDGTLCQSHELLRGSIKTKPGYINKEEVIPDKVLFIGNSLISGFDTFGMAASNSKEDIFYHLNNKIKEINPNSVVEKLKFNNMVDNNYKNILKRVEDYNYNPNLVFIFLGDNLDYEGTHLEEFANMMIYLLKLKNKNCQIYWIGGWYWSPQKTNILLPILEENKIEYIDISEYKTMEFEANVSDVITLDKNITYEMEYESYNFNNNILNINYKVNNILYFSSISCDSIYEDNNKLIINSKYYIIHSIDVATHPSSLGMKKISDKIIEKLRWNLKLNSSII